MPAAALAPVAWPGKYGWLREGVAEAAAERLPDAPRGRSARPVEARDADGRPLGQVGSDVGRALSRPGLLPEGSRWSVRVSCPAPWALREHWSRQVEAAACWAVLAAAGRADPPPPGALVSGAVGPRGELLPCAPGPGGERLAARADASWATHASIWQACGAGPAGDEGRGADMARGTVSVEFSEADAARIAAALGRMRAIQGGEAEPGSPWESEDIAVGLAEELGRRLEEARAGAPARKNPAWAPVEVSGSTAILHNPDDRMTPYVAADGYDPETNEWGAGQYRETLLGAYEAAHGAHLIDVARADVVAWSVLTHEDVWEMLEARGAEADEGLVERIADEAAGPVGDLMCERGWDALSEAVDDVLSCLGDEGDDGDDDEQPSLAIVRPGPGEVEAAAARLQARGLAEAATAALEARQAPGPARGGGMHR